jgi:TolB-like protein/class 3 adenylate cyclase/tetratricopeptide (TPR) repeat protein
MPETRRLAAIMAVDVVGYSRLMGEDEAGTARAVRDHREAARPLVAGRGGRIVKTMGDGLLLEFPSVVDAVECAVAIQKMMVERNAETAEARRIVYRIGVNLGDVLIEGDDILGDGVNIAARLEGIAGPGGICISGSAYEHVRGKIEAEFDDLGEKTLKNIGRPVRVYAIEISAAKGQSSPHAPEEKRGAPRLSIVVLPFANLSGDAEQEYFVDGVTETLTTELSRRRGLLVIGRNTAFTYKGKAVDLKRIGTELNVRYVLEGSVQRGGGRLRVNVQLLDTETGMHIWAERFDKPVVDLFDMQDEIVSRLTNTLNARLLTADAQRAQRTPHPDSMGLFSQGMASFFKGHAEDNFIEALGFFERALQLDPSNVDALVWIAAMNLQIAAHSYLSDPDERMRLAEDTAIRALSAAPDHAMAHLWMGIIHYFRNRPSLGIAECERALELDPTLAAAHAMIGWGKDVAGRGEETEAHVREALRLSPSDVKSSDWMTIAGGAKLSIGKDAEAVAWLRRAIDSNRTFAWAHFSLASALAHLGRLDEARATARAGLELAPHFTIGRSAFVRYRAVSARDDPNRLAQCERVIEGLRKAGVPEA